MARQECWTVHLVKPLVRVTHLRYSKLQSKAKWEKRVASGGRDSVVYTKRQMSTE